MKGCNHAICKLTKHLFTTKDHSLKHHVRKWGTAEEDILQCKHCTNCNGDTLVQFVVSVKGPTLAFRMARSTLCTRTSVRKEHG